MEEETGVETEAAETSSTMDTHNQIETRFEALEEGMKYMKKELNLMRDINKDLQRRLAQAEGRVSKAEGRLDKANEKIISLTTRSMKNNIVIKNLPEAKSEDLRTSLRSLFKEALKINGEMVIENVHRSGRPLRDRTRIVIAELNTQGKRTVMQHLKHLKHLPQNEYKNIRITDQYPCEIRERRTKLWPCMITAKEEGRVARLNNDKLLVDNRIIETMNDTVNNINLDLPGRALEM